MIGKSATSTLRTAVAAAALVLAPGLVLAQTPGAIGNAQRQLNAGHADSAVATLEAFFAATPQATIGRLLLGNAYRQSGQLDKALEAYAAVTTPRPARLQAWFATAAIQTERGDIDAAFETLARLKASGSYDMDLVTEGESFRSLKSDRRFAELSFKPHEFEHPFVEPVRVIHEWVGEAKGDQYSWIARGIGDVDGDRVIDIVTSAPTFGSGGAPSGPGKVYVYSGRSGKQLWTAAGQAGDNLGTGLEGAGDVDGDGVGDVVAGAPGTGRAYVYSGKSGALLHMLVSPDSGAQFGQAAAGAGDQNGDGRADVIVGAPGASANGQGAGAAFVYSGKDGTLIARLDGDSAGHAFGSIVAGDKWGRGTPLLVGAPAAGPGNRGRVYVFESAKGKRKFTIDAGETGVALGAMFTSIVGDVNGDRVPDVYAADFTDGGKGPSTGRIYVRSGVDGRELLTLSGEQPGDGFGIGSAEAGDLNGDGYDDLVVGAWQYSGAAQSGGKVYVYSGKDGKVLREITGRVPGETFGFDATGVGDIDGDGVVDLLLTSTWSNIKGFRSGRMFVISGK